MKSVRLAIAATAIVLSGEGALAYVQQRANSTPFQFQKWVTFPITYAVNKRGSTDVLTSAEFSEISAAFATWQAVANTTLQFSANPPSTESGILGDGKSTISWIDNPDVNPAIAPDVGAFTMLFLSPANDSQIVEVDMILNGAYFSWTTTAATGAFTSLCSSPKP